MERYWHGDVAVAHPRYEHVMKAACEGWKKIQVLHFGGLAAQIRALEKTKPVLIQPTDARCGRIQYERHMQPIRQTHQEHNRKPPELALQSKVSE